MNLDGLLEFLEDNIDLEHVKKVEKIHVDAVNYRKVPFLPLSIAYPVSEGIKPYKYSEAFDDPEKMLFNELAANTFNVYNSVRLKDYFPLHIRSNHGIGVIASLFGAKYKIIDQNMPWIEHFKDIKDIYKIISKGVPECDKALGRKVKQTHQYYIEKLSKYPKCFKAVRITQPDLQGPFDIAHEMLGNNIFYEVFDNPKMLHELLEIITRTYIKYRKFIDPYLTDKAEDDCMYVHGAVYGGKVILKDDTALINLSKDMYCEFSKNYNEKILKEFGTGSLHHCGPARDWHNKMFLSKHLKTLNYGNPEMHDITEKMPLFKKNKISIVGWGHTQTTCYIEDFMESGIGTGVSLAANAGTFGEAKSFLDKYLTMNVIK